MIIKMNVSIESVIENKHRFSKAAVWIDDNKKFHGVFLSNYICEVWENNECISYDRAFAMGYLRCSGLCTDTVFLTSEIYRKEVEEVDDEYSALVTGTFNPDPEDPRPF